MWLLWHGYRFEKFTNLPKIELQTHTMTADNWTKCLVLAPDNQVKILPFITTKGGNDDEIDDAPMFPTPNEAAAASAKPSTNVAETS